MNVSFVLRGHLVMDSQDFKIHDLASKRLFAAQKGAQLTTASSPAAKNGIEKR